MAGVKGRSGRPTLIQERAIREDLQVFIPDIIAFYKTTFEGSNKVMQEKISGKILDKLVANASPYIEELEERLEKIEHMLQAKSYEITPDTN